MTRLRIAVVGSGVSGLTAAYLLEGLHDVTLFERLGVQTQSPEMSGLSDSCGGCRLEYAGAKGLAGLFPSLRTMADRLRAIGEVLGDRVRLGAHVVRVGRDADGATTTVADDDEHRFDRVVVATHPDQALALLDNRTDDEQAVLGAWQYSTNETVQHTDYCGAWQGWGFHEDSCASGVRVARRLGASA